MSAIVISDILTCGRDEVIDDDDDDDETVMTVVQGEVPRWPPHLAHTISTLSMPADLSSLRSTAPGRASKNAGQPHPELNLVSELQVEIV